MTIFERISSLFHKLISRFLDEDDEIEAGICDGLDPYMIDVVQKLNDEGGKVIQMTRARPSHAA